MPPHTSNNKVLNAWSITDELQQQIQNNGLTDEVCSTNIRWMGPLEE